LDCGNPPWIEIGEDNITEKHVRNWILVNRKNRPVARGRVVEAFSWRAGEKLKTDGVIGLVHHASSLFNATSKKYRKRFFEENVVYKITNFANLRNYLFEGRATARD
jgi:hypothetical protein